MAHFAKINQHRIVTTVIVSEEEHIETLPGTWIQTSYNTYGGVHYDPKTGQPSEDQSKAFIVPANKVLLPVPAAAPPVPIATVYVPGVIANDDE